MQTIEMKMDEAIERVRERICDRPHKYYVMTFGCQQNEADSERAAGLCDAMGYLLAPSAAEADLVLINTCSIRRHAEEKALSYLGTLQTYYRADNERIIGVIGCMAQEPSAVALLKKSFPFVAFTIAPGMLGELPALVLSRITERKRNFCFAPDRPDIVEDIPAVRTSDFRALVSIMYGCNNFCSYCIVPYVRGRERSRRSEDVISECRDLIARGYREITLLGQNVNSYRSDLTFAELLERIAEIEGGFWIRFMTSHPKDVSPELIAVMAAHRDKIVPAFHLPLQSGSNRILSLMNRTYTREHYLSIVDALRAAIPDVAITTDIIVAFPTETEEDFENTLDIVRRVGYDKMFSFIYSPREGTRAATMEGHIPHSIAVSRMDRLLALERASAEHCNDAYVGTRVRVLVENTDDRGRAVGHTATGKLVHIDDATENSIGTFVSCLVERATPHGLFAVL